MLYVSVKLQYLNCWMNISGWKFGPSHFYEHVYESRRKGIIEGIPFSDLYFCRWKILFVSLFFRSFLVSIIIPCWLLNLDKMWWRQLCRHKQQTHETTSLSYFSLTTVCTLAGGFLKAFQAEKILASTLAFMDSYHLNFSSPSLLAITTDFFRC